jgi:hypothetical protein
MGRADMSGKSLLYTDWELSAVAHVVDNLSELPVHSLLTLTLLEPVHPRMSIRVFSWALYKPHELFAISVLPHLTFPVLQSSEPFGYVVYVFLRIAAGICWVQYLVGLARPC